MNARLSLGIDRGQRAKHECIELQATVCPNGPDFHQSRRLIRGSQPCGRHGDSGSSEPRQAPKHRRSEGGDRLTAHPGARQRLPCLSAQALAGAWCMQAGCALALPGLSTSGQAIASQHVDVHAWRIADGESEQQRLPQPCSSWACCMAGGSHLAPQLDPQLLRCMISSWSSPCRHQLCSRMQGSKSGTWSW